MSKKFDLNTSTNGATWPEVNRKGSSIRSGDSTGGIADFGHCVSTRPTGGALIGTAPGRTRRKESK